MTPDEPPPLQRLLLLHLLAHRGAQVRFEADQWTTEFGILRAFAREELLELKSCLRHLEMSRYVYRRVQYVIGYTEPKLVYSLTPSGHRVALDLSEHDPERTPLPADDEGAGTPSPGGPVADRLRSRPGPE